MKVDEGLIEDFRDEHNRAGPKTKDALNRLLDPEKHFKQRKLEKGKKKNCVVCTKLQDIIRVHSHFLHL